MYIKYKNKEFYGFDDVRHRTLYQRYTNLKKIKKELLKEGIIVKDYNVYKNVFDRYDFYDLINRKILELISLYKKENLYEKIDYLNLKYKEKIEKIVDSGNNHTKVHLFVRLFWSMSFFKEYFIFNLIIIRRNILNVFTKGKRIN